MFHLGADSHILNIYRLIKACPVHKTSTMFDIPHID